MRIFRIFVFLYSFIGEVIQSGEKTEMSIAIGNLAIVILISYLLGSVPTALIISKKFFGFDIRERGSGNIGSTNVIRVLGLKWGLIVQGIDILKGFLATAVVAQLYLVDFPFPNPTPFENMTLVKLAAGTAAILGHIFSVFAGFRGGKGINTGVGMLLGIAPEEVLIVLGFFLLAVFTTGYISLGSIVAAIVLPISIVIRYNIFGDHIPDYHTMLFFLVFVSLIVLYAHRQNIKRLLEGRENRFEKLWILRCKKQHV